VSPTPETIHLWGETLCLDYANSVNWSPENEHVDPEQTDVLRTGDMLGRWGRRLGLLSDDANSASEAELCRARALRDGVHRLFASASHDQKPSTGDVTLLMDNYTEAVNQATLRTGEARYQLDWPAQDPRRVRYAVATDAIDLLRDPKRLRRVSHCPGRGCGCRPAAAAKRCGSFINAKHGTPTDLRHRWASACRFTIPPGVDQTRRRNR
jgi:predicted RNA-binding Zn ribbon-like protein